MNRYNLAPKLRNDIPLIEMNEGYSNIEAFLNNHKTQNTGQGGRRAKLNPMLL